MEEYLTLSSIWGWNFTWIDLNVYLLKRLNNEYNANITKFQGVFWSRNDTLIKSFDYFTLHLTLYCTSFSTLSICFVHCSAPDESSSEHSALQEEEKDERSFRERASAAAAAAGPVDSLSGGTWDQEKMLKLGLSQISLDIKQE